AAEHLLLDRVQPFLPTNDVRVVGETVLDEIETAAGLQRPVYFRQRTRHIRYRAEGECADDRLEARIRYWNLLGRQTDELDGQRCRGDALPGQTRRDLRWIDADDLRHAWPVMRQVEAGAEADFEHVSLHMFE